MAFRLSVGGTSPWLMATVPFFFPEGRLRFFFPPETDEVEAKWFRHIADIHSDPEEVRGMNPWLVFDMDWVLNHFFLWKRCQGLLKGHEISWVCNVHWEAFMVNLDKLLFLRFFLRYQTFYQNQTVSYCYIQTPWGPWPRPWPRLGNHSQMPGLVQNFISRRKLQQLILHGSFRNNAIIIACLWTWITRSWGSQCFLWFGCRDAGRWNEWDRHLQCVPKKTPEKNPHFFATKGWSWKIQQDFFISRWKSSTFVEFSGNSIWDGQHLWWVWGRLVVAVEGPWLGSNDR